MTSNGWVGEIGSPVLALIVFIAGPTLFILNLIPSAIGDYARDLAVMSTRTEAVGGRGAADLDVRLDHLLVGLVDRAIRTGVEQHGGVQFDLVTKHDCAGSCPDPDSCHPRS